jgi:hypothetical protein
MTMSRPGTGLLLGLSLLTSCYDSGTPSVEDPRPARACYYDNSVRRLYFVFQERAQGCAVMWIGPLLGGGDAEWRLDSSGEFRSMGLADHPTLSESQVSCQELITRNLVRDDSALDGTNGKRGWARSWVVENPDDPEQNLAPWPTFFSASIDFEPEDGAPSESVRILNLELTDEETVHECPE